MGMLSIVALAASNILLTLRLIHSRDGMGSGSSGSCRSSGMVPETVVPRSWTAALNAANHTEYLAFLRSAAVSTHPEGVGKEQDALGVGSDWTGPEGAQGAHQENLVSSQGQSYNLGGSASNPSGVPHVVMGSGFKVDESLGRWDARRNYKTHDHIFTGPKYRRLAKESPVCLATQTSVDRLFWLTQVGCSSGIGDRGGSIGGDVESC